MIFISCHKKTLAPFQKFLYITSLLIWTNPMVSLSSTPGFSIGSLRLESRVILAPMAGITDRIFRMICREQGAALCITEMVSADGLIRRNRKTMDMIAVSSDDRPLGVQLFGSDPAVLAEAARIVEDTGADLVDLNFGCPVRKVVKRCAGAAILGDLDLLHQIIRQVVSAVRIPVTVKIRSGIHSDKPVAIEVGKIAEAEGIGAVALHPRSLSEGFSGKADWRLIGELVEALRIPVIGSGDIYSADDAIRMARETGCQAVMVARGALGNPHLFRQIHTAFRGEPAPSNLSPEERLDALMKHFDLALSGYGNRHGVLRMRSPIGWYIRGMPGASNIRKELMHVINPDQVRNIIQNYRKRLSTAPISH
jgi:nifR3 family TIM-barrel protein